MTAAALAAMSPAVRAAYGAAFTASLNTVFLVAAVRLRGGFRLHLAPPRAPAAGHPRRVGRRDAGNEAGEAFARPAGEEGAEAQIYGALSALSDRAVQRRHMESIVARAGETLTPLAAWLLTRLERYPEHDPFAAAGERGVEAERVHLALEELRGRGLIAEHTGASPKPPTPTPAGCDVLDRLAAARRAHLSDLAADWDPSRHPDLAAFLTQSLERLAPTAHRAGPGEA